MNAATLGYQSLRGLFALLMLSTSVTKLLDMPGFYAIVDSYRVLPAVLITPSAWALVTTELLLFAWLLWGRQLRWVGLALVVMHTVYLVWISVALARGLELDNCGCFGVYFARPLRWYTPLEDLALIAMAVAFWALARRRETA
ncbi:MAG: MauE/DoxX family redox-associated membrane protein [Polycyclovorans sp.]